MSVDRSPYPASLMTEARSLASAGWNPSRIASLFARRGLPRVPSEPTVRMWVDERYREAQLASHRRWQAQASAGEGQFRLRSDSLEYHAACARALHAEGVLIPSIVRVFRVMVPDQPWSRERVETLLNRGRVAA